MASEKADLDAQAWGPQGLIPGWQVVLLAVHCVFIGAVLAPCWLDRVPFLRAVKAYLDFNVFFRSEAMGIQSMLAAVHPSIQVVQSPEQLFLSVSALLVVARSCRGYWNASWPS